MHGRSDLARQATAIQRHWLLASFQESENAGYRYGMILYGTMLISWTFSFLYFYVHVLPR